MRFVENNHWKTSKELDLLSQQLEDISVLTVQLDAGVLRADGSALRREWLVTNGAGAFASGTVAGANTRRYHGLLTAALNAPLGRALLLSKLEEVLEITLPGGSRQQFPLSCNIYPGAIYPQGNHLLTEWTSRPEPKWTWEPCTGVTFSKRITMPQGLNAVCVEYSLCSLPEGAVARLLINPLLAWRDFHSHMKACSTLLPVSISGSRLAFTLPPIQNVTGLPTALTLEVLCDGATLADLDWKPAPEWYYNFQHTWESDRGLDSSEDLYCPGQFAFAINPRKPVVVTAAAGNAVPADTVTLAFNSADRIAAQLKHSLASDTFTRQLSLSAAEFLVKVPNKRTTIIAGYPWFGDWGRDTMIALPGVCLVNGEIDAAVEILSSFAHAADRGMIPNRFPDYGDTPEYNTVDATLWMFNAIWLTHSTGKAPKLAAQMWPLLETIIQAHQQGTRHNIHVDPNDKLLFAGEQGVQLTWMDAKVGDWVVTPRIGKPVEINALWHNALCIMAKLAEVLEKIDTAKYYHQLAAQTAVNFLQKFVRDDGKGLYDVIDCPSGGSDSAVRPNQVFALSLPFAPIPKDHPVARQIVNAVSTELLTPCGLRTLSPHDSAYRPRYTGSPLQRDGAYHQGTVWPWLLGAFAEASAAVTGDKSASLAMLEQLHSQLTTFGIGSLAEVFDGDAPHRPNGCPAQAWSVAETLRAWINLKGDKTIG